MEKAKVNKSLGAVLLLSVVYLTGCCPDPIKVSPPHEVKVLVPVPCIPTPVEKPNMPMDNLIGTESPFEMLKLALAELEIRQAYEMKLEAVQKRCTSTGEVK